MTRASLQKHLPHTPQDIYDLIMDVASYPAIYPMVRSAKIVDTKAAYRDVEMEFNLPALLGISDPVQVSRITATPASEIRVTTLKSPLKTLDLQWTLAAHKEGTYLTFHMEYETGRGFLVDKFVRGVVQTMIENTMAQFADHAAATLRPVSAQTPVARPPKGRIPGSP